MALCAHCGSELPPGAAFCPLCAQPGLAQPAPGLHPLLKQPFRDTLPPRPPALAKDLPLDRRGPRPAAEVLPQAGPRPAQPAAPPLPRPSPAAVAPVAPPSRPAAIAATPAPAISPPPDPAPGAEPEPARARVAPLWRRLLAWGVDLATLALVAALFLWVATRMVHHGPPSRQGGLDWLAETLLSYRKLWLPGALLVSVLSVLYLTLFTALGGQTPGKRLLGLEVIDRSGRCPSPVRSAFRAVCAVAGGALGLFGFFLVLVDRRGQALHDKLAGTFVVVGR
ncbi:MAG: RDD family protein [Myxococcales bacterium]